MTKKSPIVNPEPENYGAWNPWAEDPFIKSEWLIDPTKIAAGTISASKIVVPDPNGGFTVTPEPPPDEDDLSFWKRMNPLRKRTS